MFFCCLSLTFRFLPFCLAQRFSIFLTPWPFNTIPHTVVTPNYKIILLLFHHNSFATIMNPNVNMWCIGCLVCDTQRDFKPQIENCCLLHPLNVSQQFLPPSLLTFRCLPSLFASSHLCEVTSSPKPSKLLESVKCVTRKTCHAVVAPTEGLFAVLAECDSCIHRAKHVW